MPASGDVRTLALAAVYAPSDMSENGIGCCAGSAVIGSDSASLTAAPVFSYAPARDPRLYRAARGVARSARCYPWRK